LKAVLREHVDKSARLFTDELQAYVGLSREFADHQTVTHSKDEYVRGEAHVNTAEGFFSFWSTTGLGVLKNPRSHIMAEQDRAPNPRRGRPPKHPDEPIKVPLPFKQLVQGVLEAGPHPQTARKRKGRTKG
jgi:hypothetical protein